jgi:hypothetical protein
MEQCKVTLASSRVVKFGVVVLGDGPMPKRLPARWRPESIREFRASARLRFDEMNQVREAAEWLLVHSQAL